MLQIASPKPPLRSLFASGSVWRSALLLSSTLISSAANAIYFENLSIEQGLSQTTVYTMAQDKYGYMWFGTSSGLNRYDGVQFKVFGDTEDYSKSSSVLSHKSIMHITQDAQGHFWIGTHRGLTYLDTDTYKTKLYFHDPQNENSLSSDAIRRSLFDTNGYLWLATNNALTRLDPKTEAFKRMPNNTLDQKIQCSNVMREIVQDTQGQLWISSDEKGLCKFDPITERYTPVDYRGNPEESASVRTSPLFLEANDILWIGSDKGLFKYSIKTGQSSAYFHDPNNSNSLPDNSIQAIIKSDDDHLWVGTHNGLSLFNKKKNTFVNFYKSKTGKSSIGSNDIYSLFTDMSGLLWIGSFDAGVSKYNPKQAHFHYIGTEGPTGQTLSNQSVWTMIYAYDYIWIATGNGLNRLERTSGKIKHYFPDKENNLINGNTVFTLTPGENRDLWIGSRRGLSHFDIDNETFENFYPDINNPDSIPFSNTIASVQDFQGRIWLGFYGGGAALYNPNTRKFQHFKADPHTPGAISSDFVYDIHQLPNGLLLFGTHNGINKYDPTTQTFTLLSFLLGDKETHLPGVNAIRRARNGDILISGSKTLYVLNPDFTKIIEVYGKDNSLDNGSTYSTEEDSEGHIWVSSDRGLSRINRNTGEITSFDILDGLQDYEFNATSSTNDGTYLYFGGINGLNYFNSNAIKTSSFIPPIAITSFNKSGKPIDIRNNEKLIELSYIDNSFSIEFSAMDFTYPKKNQYAYKLEGFDQNWVHNGTRNLASYTNIDGGIYTFKVKGASKYGVWNEEGISLTIKIEPPPWKRWWAYLAYLCVLSLIFFLATRSKILADSKSLSDRIRKMSTTLTQTLDLPTIYKQLAEHLKLIFPYLQITLLIKNNGLFKPALESFVNHYSPLRINANIQNKLIEHIAKTRQPLLLKTPKDFAQFGLEYCTKPKLYLLILPLITRDNFVGVVILANPKQHYAFREDRINIAVTLSAQASAAIDNAHLFEKTKQLAFYDALTGLENRQLFKERLDLALKVVHRNGSELAVMFLDLDKFKRVNDSLGHDIGDALLIEAAKRLRSCVRRNDTVARIGGDEFTVLLTDVNGVSGVSTVAQKILNAFKAPITLSRHTFNVSTSIGISLAPKDSMDATGLMKNADVAMYKAKEKGRNMYQFFTEEMNIQASQQLILENDIRRALSTDEFILHYQPLIDLNTYTIIGVEALVRWRHPEKGLVMPMDFIPAAEETGLINILGEHILTKAFNLAAQFKEHNLPRIKIAVNLSARQFIYGRLIDTINQLHKHHGLGAHWLELEITENVLIENTDKTIDVLYALKDIGCTLTIDDFGTGYSSLSYLKQLPIDTIKIDRSFVKDIPQDSGDAEITAAIIAMAHNLNLTVVAEGVETAAQLEFLHQRSCDVAQGYYFHKPMPDEQLINLLKNQTKKELYSVRKTQIHENG